MPSPGCLASLLHLGARSGTARATETRLPPIVSLPMYRAMDHFSSESLFLQRSSVLACITDEASPFALRSTRNSSKDSSAPRRRSTPAERPSSCWRDAISRWKATSPPSLHGLSSAAGAVHRNTVGRPACGRSAWWPRRSGCRPRLRHPVHVLGQCPLSGVRCERPVSTLACPRDRCPVSGAGV